MFITAMEFRTASMLIRRKLSAYILVFALVLLHYTIIITNEVQVMWSMLK